MSEESKRADADLRRSITMSEHANTERFKRERENGFEKYSKRIMSSKLAQDGVFKPADMAKFLSIPGWHASKLIGWMIDQSLIEPVSLEGEVQGAQGQRKYSYLRVRANANYWLQRRWTP